MTSVVPTSGAFALRPSRWAGWLLVVCALLLAAACGRDKPSFVNTDISGASFARDFELTDHHGKTRRLADYRGKVVVMFFGFTQCPDVCPTTLQEMSEVMKALGPDADRVQVLFVTIDPERDTAQLLGQYVPAFDPRFVGLSGDMASTARTAKEFKVFYQKVPGKTETSYTMDHTAGSYVFDPQGKPRLFVKHGRGAEPLANDIRVLLKGA